MALVYGLELGEGRLADMTRKLLRLHVAMIVLGIFISVLLPVMAILLADADARIHSSRLAPPARSKVDMFLVEHKELLLGAIAALCAILPVALPISTFFVLRAAVRRSTSALMDRVWRTNHNMSWLVAMLLVATLFVIDHNISDGLLAASDGCDGIEKFDCVAYRSAQADYHRVAVGFLTCLAVAMCCQIVLGTLSTSLAHNVLECMLKGMVFAGAPPVPQEVTGEVADHFCVGKVVQKTIRHVKINPEPAIEVVGVVAAVPDAQAPAETATARAWVETDARPAPAASAAEAQAPTAGRAEPESRRSWRSLLGLLGRGASRQEADGATTAEVTDTAEVMV